MPARWGLLPPADSQIVRKAPFQAGHLVSWNTFQSHFHWIWKGEREGEHSQAVLWGVPLAAGREEGNFSGLLFAQSWCWRCCLTSVDLDSFGEGGHGLPQPACRSREEEDFS